MIDVRRSKATPVGDMITDLATCLLTFSLKTGVEKNQFFITTDFNSELFRVAALGTAPTNRGLVDRLLALVSWIAIPIWRTFAADSAIKKHRQEHLKTLAKQSE